MDLTDRNIINRLQKGFPICDQPYLAVADELGLEELDLMQRIEALLENKTLSRFGPMYHAERMGGSLSLVAMSIADDRFDEVTAIVNEFPQVAHNYKRENALNMWFVLATESPGEIATTLQAIEEKTGLKTYNMPKEEEFYVGLYFQV